jgi:thiol-disulfide isomerase/thioredoxin
LKILISFFAIIFCLAGKGQIVDSFTLSGNINRDSGQVTLVSGGSDRDYPEFLNYKPVSVIHGKFIIRELLKYPVYVSLHFTSGTEVYFTDRFYLEPGTQHIDCNADSLREKVDIKNATTSEFNTAYCSNEYRQIDTVYDYYKRWALKKLYVYRYSQSHPDSYVALWQISRYLLEGYNRRLDSAYTALSAEIKNTETGKLVGDDLKKMELTDTGKVFPELALIDMQGKQNNISFRRPLSKYTLIDFWFAHCEACIGEFPTYIELYNKYHEKGFSIIGISIDSSPSNIQSWKKIIKSKPLHWTQYRANQKTIDDLRIELYPSNFLLDSSGKIIAVNLLSNEVADLIRVKLN